MKVEKYPDYDWDKIPDGSEFSAIIEGVKCTGAIRKENGDIYLCQNKQRGSEADFIHNYKYSWFIGNASPINLHDTKVTNLQVWLNPNPNTDINLGRLGHYHVLITEHYVKVGCTTVTKSWIEAALKKMNSLKQ